MTGFAQLRSIKAKALTILREKIVGGLSLISSRIASKKPTGRLRENSGDWAITGAC